MHLSFMLLIASLFTFPAEAADNRYAACQALAASKPAQALADAKKWQQTGGSTAAMHCEAIALIHLGEPARAAKVLEVAAASLGDPPRNRPLAGRLWAQAGNAWLLANDSASAEQRLTQALSLLDARDSERAAALVDRARARAERLPPKSGAKATWALVLSDLSAAALITPDDASIFLLRATTYRHLDEGRLARADIDRAAQLAPYDGDILLERGVQRHLAHDEDGAIADWQQVVTRAAQSDAAKQAQDYLDQVVPARIKPPK